MSCRLTLRLSRGRPILQGGRTRARSSLSRPLFLAAVVNDRRFAPAKLPFSAKQIMTFSELAEYLDVPRRRLYDLVERGDGFPAFKVGRKWCADLDEVREWLLQVSEKEGSQHS